MSVKSTTDAILFMADDLGLGVGFQMAGRLCPVCGGGATKERSFSIGRSNDGVWYKCWRAKCGAKGSIDLHGIRYASVVVNEDTAHRACQEHDAYVQKLIDEVPVGDVQKFRIQAYDGRVKGIQLRSSRARNTHLKSGEFAGGFFFPSLFGTRAKIVVVEDPLSAQAVANAGTLAYCLFGTNLSDDKVVEIIEARHGTSVWLCLDKDATVKAAEYVLKYRLIAPTLKLMPIQRDLKHLSQEELRGFLYGN